MNKINLKEFIEECYKFSEEHGCHFNWDEAPKFLMLIVTEISEAMEAWRDDDKKHYEEELVDVFIRIMHMVAELGFKDSFEEMIKYKMEINSKRPYHHGRKRM